LADDNPVNRRVTSLLMDRLGYQLDLATNGSEAVGAATRYKYDVILMDVDMPLMGGLEATRRIRGHFLGRPERPYIVAITSDADEASCLAAGMDYYLRKPVGLSDLTLIVGHALAEAKRRNIGTGGDAFHS
jgi:CheY-like chemotaxis protein